MGTWEENREREKAEREALVADLIGFVGNVANQLGDGWGLKAEQNWLENGYVHIEHTDGRGICFSIRVYHPDRKVNISGDYNYGPSDLNIGWPYDKSRPEINATMSRGAEVIAKEITRRFLPTYNERFAEITSNVKTATEYRDRQTGTSKRLAKIANAGTERMNRDGAGFSVYHNDRPYFDVQVYSDVKLTINSLNEDQAAAIIRLVESWA